jgi:hypothetical protein
MARLDQLRILDGRASPSQLGSGSGRLFEPLDDDRRRAEATTHHRGVEKEALALRAAELDRQFAEVAQREAAVKALQETIERQREAQLRSQAQAKQRHRRPPLTNKSSTHPRPPRCSSSITAVSVLLLLRPYILKDLHLSVT